MHMVFWDDEVKVVVGMTVHMKYILMEATPSCLCFSSGPQPNCVCVLLKTINPIPMHIPCNFMNLVVVLPMHSTCCFHFDEVSRLCNYIWLAAPAAVPPGPPPPRASPQGI